MRKLKKKENNLPISMWVYNLEEEEEELALEIWFVW